MVGKKTIKGVEAKSLLDVADFYDKMAEEYDATLKYAYWKYLYRERNRVLAEISWLIDENTVALDAGCGSGVQSMFLARKNACVASLDLSSGLLHVLNEKRKRFHLDERITIFRGDLQHLPYKDESFDFINCVGSVLGHVPDWEKCVSELSRVLKPGGMLVFDVDNKLNFYLYLIVLAAIFDKAKRREFAEMVRTGFDAGCHIEWRYRYANGSTDSLKFRLFTFRELKNALEGEGLRIVRLYGMEILTYLIPEILYVRRRGLIDHLLGVLSKIDEKLASRRVWNKIGGYLLFICVKGGGRFS